MDIFWSGVTIVGYVLTLLLVPWVLLLKKEQPAATLAWIMAIVMLPFLGGLLFVVFGINRIERRTAGKRRARRMLGRVLPELSQYQLVPGEALDPQQERLMRLASRVSWTHPTFGNKVEVLSDMHRALEWIEEAVLSAERSLHLEYYIWKPDRTGTRVRDMLINRAREGVTVRFLYDGVGSMYLGRRFLRPMRDAGIHVAASMPGAGFRERWSVNLRNHRKIVVVDGRTGFTGGMNVGDEYLGLDPHVGEWRDTHLRLTGPAVLQLQQVFAEDWYYATGEELTDPGIFPTLEDGGNLSAQIVAGEPGDVHAFHALMFAAINEARERITLVTSYFVPPHALVEALETAAYRGVEVRLLLAGRAVYRWTVLAGRSYYESLLKAGVEIYEYEQGLLHSKLLTIDGNWSLVGTPNFDHRSLLLNFEVGVAIYSGRTALQLEAQFERDLERSTPIDFATWTKRPVRHVLGENVCRLFAPVL